VVRDHANAALNAESVAIDDGRGPWRESIDAHLAIVFSALAVTHYVESKTGWSIKKFVRTARRYRSVDIRAGAHILTAEDPIPVDLRDALAVIARSERAH
jgi:hypothetical protein